MIIAMYVWLSAAAMDWDLRRDIFAAWLANG